MFGGGLVGRMSSMPELFMPNLAGSINDPAQSETIDFDDANAIQAIHPNQQVYRRKVEQRTQNFPPAKQGCVKEVTFDHLPLKKGYFCHLVSDLPNGQNHMEATTGMPSSETPTFPSAFPNDSMKTPY